MSSAGILFSALRVNSLDLAHCEIFCAKVWCFVAGWYNYDIMLAKILSETTSFAAYIVHSSPKNYNMDATLSKFCK